VRYRSGFLENRRGQRLFFAEDVPERASREGPVWIVCSPVLEEKNVSQGAMVNAARALSASGARVIRIDYEGHGDSRGETVGLGLDAWIADIEDTATWARATSEGQLSLLGCRAGAILAARAAAAVKADRVIAWCPVLNGADYVQDLLRMNLTTQMAIHQRVVQNREAMVRVLQEGGTINVLGWNLGPALYQSLVAETFAQAVAPLTCEVDVLDLVRKKGAPPPPAVAALAAPPRVTVRAVTGIQFWIDGNFLDTQQTELIRATLEISARVSTP